MVLSHTLRLSGATAVTLFLMPTELTEGWRERTCARTFMVLCLILAHRPGRLHC